ncbi:MAG TPA: hypothetical protein VIJ82_08125 [Streptosporangiaceae bacterium]
MAAGLVLTAALAACSSSAGSSAAGASSPSASSGGASSGSAASGSTASGSAGGGASSSPASPGSGSSQAAASGQVIAGLITFKGTLNLHGASSRHASFSAFPGVTSPASSCARLARRGTPGAKGARKLFRVPSPAVGSDVYYAAEVLPYHGPGTYGKDAIAAAGAVINVGTASYNLLAASSSASVTFKANGSGSFTFANAQGTRAAGRTLSGTVSWTCSA